MNTTLRFISQKDSKTGYIFVDCTHLGMERLKLTTKIEVAISEWSKKKLKINGNGKHIDALNKKLADILNRPANVVTECHTKGIVITKDILKLELLEIISPEKFSKIRNDGKIVDIITYTKDYRQRNPENLEESTLEVYDQYVTKLKRFAAKYGNDLLLFDRIDKMWESKFVNFLYKDENLGINTKDKWIKHTKAVMDKARVDKCHNTRDYEDFVRESAETYAIALTPSEVSEMYNLQLPPKQEAARDLWVFSSETGGIRISDGLNFQNENWKRRENMVLIETIKTKDKLWIPLTKIGKGILEKYNGKLPKMPEQDINDEMKEVGKLIPSLREIELIITTKGGKRKQEKKFKYEMLQAHTARRTFCTNAIRAGYPKHLIMAISGHKKEKSFDIYVKIQQQEKAEMLKEFYKKDGRAA